MAKISVARGQRTLKSFFSITRNAPWLLLPLLLAPMVPRPAHATVAASILIDEGTGRVISAYRANSPHAPASLTKLMTLYLTFEALREHRISLNSRVTISAHAASRPPSKIYLRAGQVVTVQQLILAMAVHSANDAATALGEFLGHGNEYRFAQLMTLRAHQLGMRSTVFRNASGLPTGNYTTAHDMALLARTIHLRFPEYSQFFARRYFHWGARTYRNTNLLLHIRPEITGMKTGYTRAAGFNLVATATYGRRKVILVVLGGRTSGQRYSQAESLLAMARNGVPARGGAIMVAKAAHAPSRTKEEEEEEEPTGRGTAVASEAAETAPKPPRVAAIRAPIRKESHGFSLISRAAASTRVRMPEQRIAQHIARSIKRYGVQIGAFRNFAEARSIAKKAYYRVPGAYRSGSMRIAVVKRQHGRRTHYLARLLGFNHATAQRTCQYLKHRGIRHCQTLSYSVHMATAAAAKRAPLQHAALIRAHHRIRMARAQAARKSGVGYGLQIGVYRSSKHAVRVARAAHHRVKQSVRQQTKISVVRLTRQRHIVYAARIEGFRQQASAEHVCDRLDRRGYDCDTIAYDM